MSSPHLTTDVPCPSPTTTVSPTHKYTCPYSKDKEGRNLVVCIDGSSNRFGLRNTNVVELYSQLVKSGTQLTYYNSGVGTLARPTWRSLEYVQYWLSNKVDLLIAWNLERVILAAYRWISENYQDGDRIYLFGFSRGAYQARAIAGMIHRVGLILPGNNEQIPFAFELYSKIDEKLSGRKKSRRKHAMANELAETFKSTFCRSHVHIHFIGVWDTVSSVGVVRGKTLPSTTNRDHHMCYFRHALALDERRVKFLPEYIHGATTEGSHSDRIKEVWFAGSHSDVGGGNRLNEKLQSGDIPLLWMRKEAVEAGLIVKPTEVVWKMDDLQKRTFESLQRTWWLLEFAPIKRVVYGTQDSHTFGLHRGKPREILPGQKIHASVLFKGNYRAKAKFWRDFDVWPELMYWNDPASHERLSKLGPLWEKDIFDASTVGSLLRDIQLHGMECFEAVDRLSFMASFKQGRAAIRKSSGWESQLNELIRYSDDPKVRVSATVALSELLPELGAEYLEKAAADVLRMLESKDDINQIRACKALPALVKHAAVGSEILSEKTFQRVLDLGGVSETESLTVQLHASQTLSLLARRDGYRPALTDKAAKGITDLLGSEHEEILVAALRILAALVHDETAQNKVLGLIPVLIKHLKQHDFYISPPVGNVICAYATHVTFRQSLLKPESSFLELLVDMLEHRLTDIEDPAIHILRHLAHHIDVQEALIGKGHIKHLASLMKSRRQETSNGATLAMLSILPHPFLRFRAIEEGVVETLVNHLKHQKKCLFAAYAFSLILGHENIRKAMFELSAPIYIVGTFKRGSFNGTVENEPGKVVLGRLMHNDDLRAAVLKAHTTAALCAMFRKGKMELNHAAFDFLDIMSNYPDGKELIKDSGVPMFRAIVAALDQQNWDSQKNAAMALHNLFGVRDSSEKALSFVVEEFQSVILEGIPDILKLLVYDRSYRVVGGAVALLALSEDGTVRARVREHADFRFVRNQYFSRSMKLQYHGSDPREEDVHKILDKLFAVMEENTRHRGALRFPEVHPIPSRSVLVTSLAILSCVFYIPCGLTAMLAGLAIDKTETSPNALNPRLSAS